MQYVPRMAPGQIGREDRHRSDICQLPHWATFSKALFLSSPAHQCPIHKKPQYGCKAGMFSA